MPGTDRSTMARRGLLALTAMLALSGHLASQEIVRLKDGTTCEARVSTKGRHAILKTAFGTRAAWRGWSDVTPGVHIAMYEFPDLARAREISTSDEIKAMIAEFDRVWGDRVQRTREILEIKHKPCGYLMNTTTAVDWL